jgi:kynurenine formamidase
MAIIDLSMTVQPTWRWPVEIATDLDFDRGDPYRSTSARMSMHAFTHVDAPLHAEPGRESIDRVPVDSLCGPAAVVDLRPVTPNQKIAVDLLEARSGHLQKGDILILKTCWDRQREPTSREFWLEAPYLHEEAAAWLAEQPVKAVGYDFPQDYAIREIPDRHPQVHELSTHDLVLRKGIYMIEYLCNLDRVEQDRATIYALPLKVLGSEGACARVVAVTD